MTDNERPAPWRTDLRVGHWYVVAANGAVVAGAWSTQPAAWEWLETNWPHMVRSDGNREK